MPLVEYGVYGVLIVGALSLIIGLTHKNYIERLLFAACCVSASLNYYYLQQISTPPEIALQGSRFEHFTASAILASGLAVAFVVTFARRLNSKYCLSIYMLLGLALIAVNYAVDGRGLLYYSVAYDYQLDSFLYGPMTVYSRELNEWSFLAQGYFMLGLLWTSAAIVLRLRYLRKQAKQYLSSIMLLSSYFVLMLALVGHDIAVDYGLLKPPYLSQLANFWLVFAAGVGMVQSQFMVIHKLRKQSNALKKEIGLKDAANAKLLSIACHDTDTDMLNSYGFYRDFPAFVEMARTQRLRMACHVLKVGNYTHYARQSSRFGHGIIRTLDARIRADSNAPCLLARISFDEIIVLCLHKASSQGEEAQFLGELIERPMQLEGNVLSPTIDVGGIVDCSLHWSADDIVHYGRAALSSAQKSNRKMICYLDQLAVSKVNEDHQLEEDLARALGNGEVSIAVQPKYSGAGELLGGEVLARWQHPVLGTISPDRFIEIAEQCGLIAQLGHKILDDALGFIASSATLFEERKLRLAVNVSPWQLQCESFSADVLALLDNYQLPPERLELEITESTFVDDTLGISARLRTLKEAGITISLDDFGTGFSSLSQLFAMPISTLKVDRAFVGDTADGVFIHNHRLLVSIQEIASSMGLSTVVEGVETREQVEILKGLGYNCFQGYYFSRPISPDEFLERARSEAMLVRGARAFVPRIVSGSA